MTPQQISQAKRLTAHWKPDPDECGEEAFKITKTETAPVETVPPETPPLCPDVFGYEA